MSQPAPDCIIDRLTARCEPNVVAGCLNWTGPVDRYGAPVIRWQGKTQQARRVAYQVMVGPLTDEQQLKRTCPSKRCINTEHVTVTEVRPRNLTVAERLDARSVINIDTGCIVWTGTIDANGYGHISVDGRMRSVHRLTYELFVGPIPENLVLDHLCRNRACRNADHLEPVTLAENNLRGEGCMADYARRTHCPQGHEYTATNTRINKSGSRVCRACDSELNRRYRTQMERASQQASSSLTTPGDHLQRWLDTHPMTVPELAIAMDRSTAHVKTLLRGQAVLTPETARRLERVTTISADDWLDHEAVYRAALEKSPSNEQAPAA